MSRCPCQRLLIASLVAVVAAIALGCSPSVRWPNLFHPGPAGFQRDVAVRYDPYPSPDAGPEIVGGRPLGYQRPLNDVEWSRRFARPRAVSHQPTPLPPITAVPAPNATAPVFAPAPATLPSPPPRPAIPFQHSQSPY